MNLITDFSKLCAPRPSRSDPMRTPTPKIVSSQASSFILWLHWYPWERWPSNFHRLQTEIKSHSLAICASFLTISQIFLPLTVTSSIFSMPSTIISNPGFRGWISTFIVLSIIVGGLWVANRPQMSTSGPVTRKGMIWVSGGVRKGWLACKRLVRNHESVKEDLEMEVWDELRRSEHMEDV